MMPTRKPAAALQGFIDDELLRAPLLVDQVVEAAIEHMGKNLPGMMPAERAVVGDLMQCAMAQRARVCDAYVQSLREQLYGADARPALAPVETSRSAMSLSLVDEDEVAIDVEISHTIEAIRSTCEYELRELQTFVSALVGDMDVASDHNPFRAETHARALWSAMHALPLSRPYRLRFMRYAGNPLAQVLRKSYAAASSRLESMGIEPAAYRTMILPAGSRRPRMHDTSFSPDLQRIRDSMPVPSSASGPRLSFDEVLEQLDRQLRLLPAEAGITEHGQLFADQRSQLIASATSAVDAQSIELFGRLFDAMLSDPLLRPDIQLLLSRLQASALRVALRDPKTLDDRAHPVWGLIDRIAFQGEILPEPGDPQRERALNFVRDLIQHLVAEPVQDSALFNWATERLRGHELQRLRERAHAAQTQITLLQQKEDELAGPEPALTTLSGTFDVGQMDTVPAALISDDGTAKKPVGNALDWLLQRQAGEWVRMFMQGRWVHAQIIWPGERGELWLFADAASNTTWVVRQRALLTLHTEHLLDTLEPRSLLVDAAKRVMRRAARG